MALELVAGDYCIYFSFGWFGTPVAVIQPNNANSDKYNGARELKVLIRRSNINNKLPLGI